MTALIFSLAVVYSDLPEIELQPYGLKSNCVPYSTVEGDGILPVKKCAVSWMNIWTSFEICGPSQIVWTEGEREMTLK